MEKKELNEEIKMVEALEGKKIKEIKEKKEAAEKKEEANEEKKEGEKQKEDKKKEKKIEKKEEAIVNGKDLRMSTKKAGAICNFIRGKKIDDSIEKLEKTSKLKLAIPIIGEYPHKKGMMSGIYPVNASKIFIKLLKSLRANALVNGLEPEESVVSFAKADIASLPHRAGGARAKRANVLLKAREASKK